MIDTVWPFTAHPAMPEGEVQRIHTLLALHTTLTLGVLLAGPVMIGEALRDRAGATYWFFAALPFGIEAQRLAYGNACVVQEVARRLWGVTDGRWAPDLYGVHESFMTYVVDACIASYAVGLLASVALFLKRRRGWFGGARERQRRVRPATSSKARSDETRMEPLASA
jgi:hypothetical protein